MESSNLRWLIGTGMPSPPVASKDATCTGKETNEEGNEGTKCEPIRISVLSANPVIPENVPRDPPEYHVDHPNNEGAEEGETGDEGHEHCARAVVCSPAKAEDNSETRKTSSCGNEIRNQGLLD